MEMKKDKDILKKACKWLSDTHKKYYNCLNQKYKKNFLDILIGNWFTFKK